MDFNDPWRVFLSAFILSIHSKVHTTTQATPMQLVFGCDAIMNLNFYSNWHMIKQRKQSIINKKQNEKQKKNSILVQG